MNKERVLFIIIYLPVTPTLRSRRLMAWGQLNITMVNKVPPPPKKKKTQRVHLRIQTNVMNKAAMNSFDQTGP